MKEERRACAGMCCGTCRHHVYEEELDGWICCCSDSSSYASWTEDCDGCGDWEERE